MACVESLKSGISLDAEKKDITGIGTVCPSLVYTLSLRAVKSEFSIPSADCRLSTQRLSASLR